MYSYNNIIQKDEPKNKELIDNVLDGLEAKCDGISSTTDPKVDVITMDNFLSNAECDMIIKACEKVGYTFWKQKNSDAEASTTDANCHVEAKMFRSVDTIEGNFPKLARFLFERLSCVMDLKPKTFSPDMEGADDLYERSLEGTWVPYALSEDLLLGKYYSGGHFAPHMDGSTIVDINTQSFYTLLIYLNDCDIGGETFLFSGEYGKVTALAQTEQKYRGREEFRVGAVHPRKGRATCFYYNVLHEGAPVGEGGIKYILRSDILYRRTPPILTEPNDIAAFKLYEEARVVESNGDAMKACEMFRRVSKLSKGVAELFQL